MNKDLNKKIFDEARDYLLSFPGASDYIIERHLNLWRKNNPNSLNDLLYGILSSVTNKRGMRNSIKGSDLKNIGQYLGNYSPIFIVNKFGNECKEDWKNIFLVIQREYKPQSRIDINVPQNAWVIFCKAVISASCFLTRFSSKEEFDIFVSGFYINEYSRLALPLLLDKEIFGLGFALACDFLKENGYPKFIKPDTHIIDIFKGLEFSKPDADDFQIFKDVIKYSQSIDEIPYVVDKLFWLVGSGNFYLDKIKIMTDKFAFILMIKSKYFK